MRLTGISIHPVKSMAGHDLEEAEVQPWGLAGDRRYLVVDERGRALTAREHPELLSCVPHIDGDAIILTGPRAAPLRVVPASDRSEIDVGYAPIELTDCGDDAAEWLATLLDRPARLAWLDDPTRRPVNPLHGEADDRVNLADRFPLLLTTTASLRRLNDWISESAADGRAASAPLPMGRFRPNVVVDDVPAAFEEDGWERISIGGVEFRVTGPCDRCVMTTIDLDTYTKGKEPIRTLAKHRRWNGKVWFGVHLVPRSPGRIRLGDPVDVSAYRPAGRHREPR